MTIINFGKYKLLKQIGRGGMAEIYLASTGSVKINKFVVIKRILSSHSQDKELKKMFFNEGRAVTQISHNNIAPVFESGEIKNQQYICMEYVKGCNLKQLVQQVKKKSKRKTLSLEVALHIIRNTCLGLDYAHTCINPESGKPFNLIHRDISPQNIMLGYNGDIKVIDFGIVKIEDSEATRVGVLKGKFVYMSPEQVKGLPLDKRTDIFSMGSVLFELLTGKKLFSGNNEIQILTKIKEFEVPDLKSFNPSLDNAIIDIVKKSLIPNRNLRYQNCGDMANDLSIYLNKNHPYFTDNTFAKFIKEIFTDEILKENERLNKYKQIVRTALEKEERIKKRMPKTIRQHSPLKSTFIGGDTKLNQKNSKTPHTRTETQTLESETKRKKLPSITQTKFDDALEPSKTMIHQKKLSPLKNTNTDTSIKQKTSTTHGLVFQSGDQTNNQFSPFTQRTNHYVQDNVSDSNLSIDPDTLSHQRKKSKLKLSFLATLSIVGFGLLYILYQGFIVEKKWNLVHIANNLGIKIFKKDLIGYEANPPSSKNKAHTNPDLRHRDIASLKNRTVFFNIHIDTTPSGASLILGNKKQNKKTPASIKIRSGKNLYLKVSKKGYKSESRLIQTRNKVPPHKLHIRLKKIVH